VRTEIDATMVSFLESMKRPMGSNGSVLSSWVGSVKHLHSLLNLSQLSPYWPRSGALNKAPW